MTGFVAQGHILAILKTVIGCIHVKLISVINILKKLYILDY